MGNYSKATARSCTCKAKDKEAERKHVARARAMNTPKDLVNTPWVPPDLPLPPGYK